MKARAFPALPLRLPPPEQVVNFMCRLIFQGHAFYCDLEPSPTQPTPWGIGASVARYAGLPPSTERDFLILADAVGLRGDA